MPTEENNQEPVEQDETNEQNEPTDWESKYREAIKHSRTWEKQAKANKAAADEPEKIKAEKLTKEEKLQKQLEEATAKAEALQAEKNRAVWVKEASKQTGVPEDILAYITTDTQEELTEIAEKLADKYSEKEPAQKQPVPVVLGDGKHAKHPEEEAHGDFIRELFEKRN